MQPWHITVNCVLFGKHSYVNNKFFTVISIEGQVLFCIQYHTPGTSFSGYSVQYTATCINYSFSIP